MPNTKSTQSERFSDLKNALVEHQKTYDELIKKGSTYSAQTLLFGRISTITGTYTNQQKYDAIDLLLKTLNNLESDNPNQLNSSPLTKILLNGETGSVIFNHLTAKDLALVFENLLFISPSELNSAKGIGSGNQGIIEKAFYNGNSVVQKHSKIKNAENITNLKKEAKILANISHPNCVKIWGYNLENSYSIIMEYVPYTLHDVTIKLRNTITVITPSLLHKFSREMATALSYLHDKKIIHMDLKPNNILVTEDFHIKIIDFGLSYHPIWNNQYSARGTPQFSAPEVLRRESFTTSADIYSLGIVLWSMVVGQLPYFGLKQIKVIHHVSKDSGFRPLIQKGQMDSKLSTCIQTLWHHNPEQRPTAKSHLDDHNTEALPEKAFRLLDNSK